MRWVALQPRHPRISFRIMPQACWTTFASAAVMTALVLGQETSPAPLLSLTASSPFRMLLAPTVKKLTLTETHLVEDAIASTVLGMQTDNIFLELETVAQEIELVQRAGEENSSRINFFVLGTLINQEGGPGPTNREILDALLVSALVDSTIGRNQFLELLQSSISSTLSNVTSVAVSPVKPAAVDDDPKVGTETSRKLSKLDVALIVVSGLIFVGIMYMIVQHHKDRGYIENERMRVLNETSSIRFEEAEPPGRSPVLHPLHEAKTRQHDMEDPSTPSTARSRDVMEFSTDPQTPDRTNARVVTLMPGLVQEAPTQDSSSAFAASQLYGSGDSEEHESIDEEGSKESSVDIFRVGVEGSGTEDAHGKQESSSVAVSEWMKSIQVVSCDKTAETTTQSSHGEHSSLDVESLEKAPSLEQSMASSDPDAEEPQRKRPAKLVAV